MKNKEYSSYVDGQFNPMSHNKMLLSDMLKQCNAIAKAYESIASLYSMAVLESSADVCGDRLLKAFYDFLPVVNEVKEQIENDLD